MFAFLFKINCGKFLIKFSTERDATALNISGAVAFSEPPLLNNISYALEVRFAFLLGNQSPLVIGKYSYFVSSVFRIIGMINLNTPQSASKGFDQVFGGEGGFRRAGGNHRPIDDYNMVAKLRDGT